ncbi:MAG: YdcF family protein [Planctomycetes bacterium]|nr:YdcF family protein [Planctomycetota bacterium]
MSSERREKSGTVKQTIGRAIACFIGCFSLLNVLGQLRIEGFNANNWWIDFASLKPAIASMILVIVSLLLLLFTIMPNMPRRLRGVMDGLLLFLLVICIYNTCTFFNLLRLKTISSGFPVPFSLLTVIGIIIVLYTSSAHIPRHGQLKRGMIFLITFGFCMGMFPLAQMFCFGKTDYRRDADVIVVFGAGVKKDGTMSDALTDRTVTGCNLYLKGFAPKIIFSGGPGPGAVGETEAMKKRALEMGVPEKDIIIDTDGLNTKKTVENTSEIFQNLSFEKVIAVSHYYHLPRIKMTYQRHQYQVLTVPAKESRYLLKTPQYLLREVAALWVYYLRPLAPGV